MTEPSEQRPAPPVVGGTGSQARNRFQAAWAFGGDPSSAAPELLPNWLATICQAALRADGAGLSVLAEDYRVPIGASSEIASAAERLQFTVGEGPCITALRTGRPVRAGAEQIREKWPAFYDGLIRRTPFRSIVATPLSIAAGTKGALDMYFCEAGPPAAPSDREVAELGRDVTSLLAFSGAAADTVQWTGVDLPAWMYGPSARRRLQVWVAVGMVMWQQNLSGPTALAVLRAYAYSHDLVLDDVCETVIAGRLDEAELRP